MLLGAEKASVIVGHFGSGKSEVAVNLALWIRATGRAVTLVDLDLVHPYFRSREAAGVLEAQGIRVVLPDRRYLHADLPILASSVRGHLMGGTDYGVLDVGGDDVGARVLGALADALGEGHRILMVLNARRPFSGTVEGCLRMQREIEEAARLRITGYISNTHMMAETDAAMIREGVALATAVGRETGLPVEFATAPRELSKALEPELAVPVLSLDRHLLPPWLEPGAGGPAADRAARVPRPLFRP